MTNPFDEIKDHLSIIEFKVDKALSHLSSDERSHIMSRKMIAKEYTVSFSTIHKAMRNGRLLSDKIGSRTIFKREDVERWVTER